MSNLSHSEPVLTSDAYMEWALLTQITDAAFESKEGLSPQTLQLVIECSEEEKRQLQSDEDRNLHPFVAEYGYVAFHEIAQGEGNRKIYSVSVSSDRLRNWRLTKLQNMRVEFSTARKTPIAYLTNFPKESTAGIETKTEERLTGNVMVIIDDGLAFLHRNFRKNNGTETRIKYFWDQDPSRVVVKLIIAQSRFYFELTIDDFGDVLEERKLTRWREVDNFAYGRELDASKINELIEDAKIAPEREVYESVRYRRVRDTLAHGTHVADMAAGAIPPRHIGGRGDAAGEEDTSIIMVQLPPATVRDTSGGGTAKHVLDAIKYALSKVDDTASVVVNLSFGATGGPHDGTSLFERALDSVIQYQRSIRQNFAMVLPAGNHFDTAHHAAGTVRNKAPVELKMLLRAEDPTETFCEIWLDRSHLKRLSVKLRKPNDSVFLAASAGRTVFDGTAAPTSCCGLAMVARPTARNEKAMVLIALQPTLPVTGDAGRSPYGEWTIRLSTTSKGDIPFDAWIQRDDPGLHARYPSRQALFLSPRPRQPAHEDDSADDPVKRRGTGNSIAHGEETIVVGACFALSQRLPFYTAASTGTHCREYWPDLVAPADLSESTPGLLAAGSTSGVTVRLNGTSVAAPQIARAILNLYADPRRGSKPNQSSSDLVIELLETNKGCPAPIGEVGQEPVLPDITYARVGAGWLFTRCSSS